MGSYLLQLRHASSRPLPIKRLPAYFPTAMIRSYNSQPSKENNGHRMERARTTAEEFESLAEELEKVAEAAKARQGVPNQTIGNEAQDGKEEAAINGDSRAGSGKEKYKEEPVG